MSDEKATAVVDVANAVAAIIKEVPVYQDAVQPVAQEVGKSLKTVGQTVNALLSPLRAVIWGFERIEDFLREKVGNKLSALPPEDIVMPKASVAVPTIQALQYLGSEPDLADMFANLLATAMTKNVANNAHPSFVEIIKSLNSDEAKIIKYLANVQGGWEYPVLGIRMWSESVPGYQTYMNPVSAIGVDAGCEHPGKIDRYLDNLSRLGLVVIDNSTTLIQDEAYAPIRELDFVKSELGREIVIGGKSVTLIEKKGIFRITSFGICFLEACSRR